MPAYRPHAFIIDCTRSVAQTGVVHVIVTAYRHPPYTTSIRRFGTRNANIDKPAWAVGRADAASKAVVAVPALWVTQSSVGLFRTAAMTRRARWAARAAGAAAPSAPRAPWTSCARRTSHASTVRTRLGAKCTVVSPKSATSFPAERTHAIPPSAALGITEAGIKLLASGATCWNFSCASAVRVSPGIRIIRRNLLRYTARSVLVKLNCISFAQMIAIANSMPPRIDRRSVPVWKGVVGVVHDGIIIILPALDIFALQQVFHLHKLITRAFIVLYVFVPNRHIFVTVHSRLSMVPSNWMEHFMKDFTITAPAAIMHASFLKYNRSHIFWSRVSQSWGTPFTVAKMYIPRTFRRAPFESQAAIGLNFSSYVPHQVPWKLIKIRTVVDDDVVWPYVDITPCCQVSFVPEYICIPNSLVYVIMPSPVFVAF